MTDNDQQIEDPIDKLYKVVRSKGYYTKSLDDFKAKYSNQNEIDKLYQVVNADSLYTKSKDEFYTQYYPTVKKKEPSGLGSSIGGMVGNGKTPSGGLGESVGALIETQTQIVEPPPKKETFDEWIAKKPVIAVNPKDPVKSIKQKSFEAKTRLMNLGKEDNPLELREVVSASKDVDKNIFQDSREAREWLFQNDKEFDEKNETDVLARNRIHEYEKTKNIIDQNYGNAEKTALALYADTDDRLKKLKDSGSMPDERTKGILIEKFLNDRNVKEIANESPEFHNIYKEQQDNFRSNYPELWGNQLLQKIAQGREDYGYNNPFLNLVGAKSSDKVIENLFMRGEIDEWDRKHYYEKVRPLVKFHIKAIPTTGILENAFESAKKGIEGIPKGVWDLTGLDKMLTTPESRAYHDLEEDASQVTVKPKDIINRVSQATGNLAGVLAPIGLASKGIAALNVIKNPKTIGELALGMTFYHDLYKEAEKNNPEGGYLNQIQALLQSAVYAKIAPALGELSKGIVKEATPEIRTILSKLESESITGTAAQEQATKTIVDKIAHIAKGSITPSLQMSLAEGVNDVIGGVFTGKFDVDETAQKMAHTFENMMLGTPLLSMLHARATRDMSSELLDEMANRPDYYKSQIESLSKSDPEFAKQAPQLLENLDHLTAVKEALSEREDLKPEQKKKYQVLSLAEKILTDRANSIPDKGLKPEKQLKEIEIEKNSIVNSTGKRELVEEFYDEELIPKSDRGLLENNETGKFEPNKAGEYLKYIAQQSNNLDANWKPHEGEAPKMDHYPQQLIEEANTRWSKEIEAAKPKEETVTIDQNRELDTGEGQEVRGEPEQITQPIELSVETTPNETQSSKPASTIPEQGEWKKETKVVDKGGEPLKVYHGTTADISGGMKPKSMGTYGDHEYYYFAKDKKWVDKFRDEEPIEGRDKFKTHEFNLDIRNPLDITGQVHTVDGWIDYFKENGVALSEKTIADWQRRTEGNKRLTVSSWQLINKDNGMFRQDLINSGHDGLIISDYVRGKTDNTVFVALRPDQIKPTTPASKLPEQGGEGKKKKNMERANEARKVYEDIGEVDEPLDARGAALAYFAGGGKINEATLIKEVVGSVKRARLNTGEKEKKGLEAKARDYVSPDGKTLSEIAHEIWEGFPESVQENISDKDVLNELIDVVSTHNTRLSAATEFRDRYVINESKNQLTEQEAKEISDIELKQLSDIVEGYSEAQQSDLIELIAKYQDKYGIVDWARLEADTNGFNTDILSLPLETINSLNEIVQKNLQSGQGQNRNAPSENIGKKEKAEERLKSAQSEYDKAKAELKKAEDKISQKQATQSGMFDATQKEMFGVDRDDAKKILDPLRNNVKETKTELDAAQKEIDNVDDQPKLALDENKKQDTKSNEPVTTEEISTPKSQPDKDSQPPKEGTGEPPKEGTTVIEGEGDVGGITHAANEVRRQDRLLPEYQKEPQTFEAWNNEAEKAVKDGYDVEKLMNEIEAGKDPTPVENAIRKIYIATLDAEIAKNPTDALLAKQKRFIEIGDLANSRAGRNLVSLKGDGSPLSSISDFYVAKMEAAGVDKLTEAQKKETKEAFDKVQKADENATAAMEAYREEIAKLKAENELLKQKKEAKPKKEKGDFAQQRKDAIAGAREALKKLRTGESGLSAVPLPGIRELIAIAPHVKKYVGAVLGEGVYNLKEVVSKAYEEFKDILEGITEKDIHNILAGEHNEPRPTRNELAAKMRDLKDEAYYINKLERLLAGTEPKSEKNKVVRNRQITELQKKIKDLQKDLPPTDAELKKRLEAIKSKNETEAANIKERIAKGNFETKKKVPFLEDPEMKRKFPKQYKAAIDAIIKREDARHEFDIALLKDQMAKRSIAKKYVVDLAGDILGTTRALTTGIDASGIGIQNIVGMVAHPRSALKALPASFGDFVSAKNQERWLASVHSSKDFPLAKKFGLDITEPQSLKASEREEIFTHNLLDRRIRYNYKGKEKTFVISKYTTKPFERIFTGLGNRMRWNLWQRGLEQLYQEGYTPEKHPEQFESLAKVLNTETGRGTLHPTIKKGYDFWSSIIWSPRLMASRLNILGLGDLGNLVMGGKKGYYGGLTPRMREYAIKDVAKFIAFGSTMLALAGITFADDTDIDPNSGTFGTFEANGKRYNIWGGFTQYVRLTTKLAMGGENQQGKFVPSNQLKTGLRFLWSKTTPVVGTGISMLNKDSKDYMGKTMTASGAIENLTVPLSIRGIINGVKKEGLGSIVWTGVPSFVGMNVSYESDFNSGGTKREKPKPQKPTKQKQKPQKASSY